MKIKIFEFGPLAVNTYVLSDETGECVIIDPACWYPHEKETLFNYIKQQFYRKTSLKHPFTSTIYWEMILLFLNSALNPKHTQPMSIC